MIIADILFYVLPWGIGMLTIANYAASGLMWIEEKIYHKDSEETYRNSAPGKGRYPPNRKKPEPPPAPPRKNYP